MIPGPALVASVCRGSPLAPSLGTLMMVSCPRSELETIIRLRYAGSSVIGGSLLPVNVKDIKKYLRSSGLVT